MHVSHKTLLTLVGFHFSTVAAQCTQPIVRREWNQLSTADKTQYVAAAKASAKSLTGSLRPGEMSLYDFVADHTQAAGVTHGNAQFYPFHRAMLYLWETTLAANGWTGGVVYWDWSAVSQNWWQADVFKYFGAKSRSSDNCVVDGQFAIGLYKVSPNPAFGSFARDLKGGDTSCLRRCGYPGTTLDTPEAIAATNLRARDYSQFRGDDSTGYHANAHIYIGGEKCDMGNFFSSPNDPIFFLHHAFVDKTWWKWQMLCPEYLNDYEGAMVVSPATPSGVASLQQILDGWGGLTVQQMMDTQNGNPLCYTYSESAGDVTNFRPPNCPSGAPANTKWPFSQALRTAKPSTSGISATSLTSSTSSSSIATATTPSKLGENALLERTWFHEMIHGLVVVRGANSPGFSVPPRPPSTLGSNLQIQRRDNSSDKNSILFNNLSDDGWQNKVRFNALTNYLCYNELSDCVHVPDSFSIHAIYKDFVSIRSNDWTYGSPIDQDHPMPIRMLYPPSKLSCEPYQLSSICSDSTECIGIPPMPSEKQLQSRMINQKLHQCYLNKVWKSIETCNNDPSCTSVATTSLKYFIQNQHWGILENATSAITSSATGVAAFSSISVCAYFFYGAFIAFLFP